MQSSSVLFCCGEKLAEVNINGVNWPKMVQYSNIFLKCFFFIAVARD